MKHASHLRLTVTFTAHRNQSSEINTFEDDYVISLNDLYKPVQLWVDIIAKDGQVD